MSRLSLTQEVVIRAIHNLEHPELTPEQNEALYGPCYGQHGHHYKIQVTISAPLDPKSGLIFNRDLFSQILQERIVAPYDGVNLNTIFANSSCEALAVELFELLKPEFPPGALKRVGIQETRKNYFEYSGENS